MNEISSNIVLQEQEFAEVISIIQQHQSTASRLVNEQLLLTAWHVGSYVSVKLKSEEWGSKVVSQLSEYIRSHRPNLKGYSRRNIYNMVQFFDEYSTENFCVTVEKFLSSEFVQPRTAQLPKLLTMITFSNHTEILCRCHSNEERLFYILYAHKEHLNKRELQRCITNQTYATLLGDKNNLSKGLLDAYPNAPMIFKDTIFLDFLGLPKKHSEAKLRNGLIGHMKQFILELGKDFLFMD